jgi:hypothetical protein
MLKNQWTTRWKTQVAPTRLPGIWRRKEGGFLVRARIVDPTNGKMKEIKKVLPDATEATAFKWLEDERGRVQTGIALAPPQQTRFADYAASLVERKVKAGDIRSATGRQRWLYTLEHLIRGTTGESEKFVNGFGEMFIDKIHVTHVEAWRTGVAGLIASGDYSPNTSAGWLAILHVIMKAAKRDFGLSHLATDGVKNFDTSEHETYSHEEPNSLLPDEVPLFLQTMRDMYRPRDTQKGGRVGAHLRLRWCSKWCSNGRGGAPDKKKATRSSRIALFSRYFLVGVTGFEPVASTV